MRNQEELNRVIKLINEMIEIGLTAVDQEKSKGSYKNFLGQEIKNIVLKSNSPGVYYLQQSGPKVLHPRVKEIGQELYNMGGRDLMAKAYYEITNQFGKEGLGLKVHWLGIGNWTY